MANKDKGAKSDKKGAKKNGTCSLPTRAERALSRKWPVWAIPPAGRFGNDCLQADGAL